MKVNSKKTIRSLARVLRRAFQIAECPEEIEPVFREAAEGEGGDSGGGWHAWAPIGIPGAKFHTMTGQAENSNRVRQDRKHGKAFRNKIALGRPDYYDSFAGVNSLKM